MVITVLHKSIKLLDIVKIAWGTPLAYLLHLVHVSMDTSVVTEVTKAVELISIQFTLLTLKIEA